MFVASKRCKDDWWHVHSIRDKFKNIANECFWVVEHESGGKF